MLKSKAGGDGGRMRGFGEWLDCFEMPEWSLSLGVFGRRGGVLEMGAATRLGFGSDKRAAFSFSESDKRLGAGKRISEPPDRMRIGVSLVRRGFNWSWVWREGGRSAVRGNEASISSLSSPSSISGELSKKSARAGWERTGGSDTGRGEAMWALGGLTGSGLLAGKGMPRFGFKSNMGDSSFCFWEQ